MSYKPEVYTEHFYVYVYYREYDSENGLAGSPYYIGKGKGRRYRYKHDGEVHPPRDRSLITMAATDLTEQQAFDLERQLIAEYGRIDRGTGILRNKTDGGEGSSGHKQTREQVENRKKAHAKWREENPDWAPRPKGHKQSAEHIEKRIAPHRGAKRSQITCDRIRELATGRTQTQQTIDKRFIPVVCEHCNKPVDSGNYRRWHGMNCKSIDPQGHIARTSQVASINKR